MYIRSCVPWNVDVCRLRRLYIPDRFALEFFNGAGQLLHVVVENIREVVVHCDIVLGRHWHQLPADLTWYCYGIVVVIVTNLILRLVQRLPGHILRHVHPRSIRLLCLNCIFSISTESRSRVPEQQLLEPPLPGIVLSGIVETERTRHWILLNSELGIIQKLIQNRFQSIPIWQVDILIHVEVKCPVGSVPILVQTVIHHQELVIVIPIILRLVFNVLNRRPPGFHPQNQRLKSHRQTRPTTHHVSLSKPLPLPPRPPPRTVPKPASAAGPVPSSFSSLCPPAKSDLVSAFSGRRSTRMVSKMHLGRPKTTVGSRHSPLAEEALETAIRFGKDDFALDDVLHSFESRLVSDDFTFLLRELGNRGECWKAIRCFEFAVRRERKRTEQGKLASSMISTLGRLGKVELAKNVFQTAVNEGYGRTVYTYSALISAYGRSGYCDEAIRVLESMKDSGVKPNLVTYNAVIDACGKGGVEFKKVVEIFDEMLKVGVQPDRITYNSLLAVCSRGGLWEAARNLFSEMVDRGIDQDIYTYNTLLDAISKGGQMDLAYKIMSEMPSKNILPNVVTYSTMIDGYAKAGRLEDALNLFNEMKFLAIGLDRVLYNTLLSLYGKLGRFEEALNVCKEMESVGIAKDVVSYNALLGGYGKQGKYDEVKGLYNEMKVERVSPNLLTYSTLIDVYSKGGLYAEAVKVFREFKQAGLKADVVLYSELINALCKNGLVESAVSLLDEMTKEGIRPNVVTYNSIIDAFGRPATTVCAVDAGACGIVLRSESSSSISARDFDISDKNVQNEMRDREDTRIMKMFGQLTADKAGYAKKDRKVRQEILCILGVFQKMHELDIKPNVVTFSAILNACSRCNSFEDASMLLEELRLFDNQVYGVAHGLLMGCRGNVWVKAQSLFDEVKQMDCSTASAFYNALTDMLWHFGQKKGAQLVVLEGERRNVWENAWSNSRLDLHLMSSGAARAMVHAWLLNIHSIVYQGQQLPNLLSILTGWGKHSKVVGDSALRRAVEALLTSMGAPFRVHECNIGRFISTGSVAAAWLKESGTLEVLMLHDDRAEPNSANFGQISDLRALAL